MGRGSSPLSGGRVEESDLELSVITSQNSHYGGSDRSMGQIRENISTQKIFDNKFMMKIFGEILLVISKHEAVGNDDRW